MWSFRPTNAAPWENETVVLTNEEGEECQRFIRSVTTTSEGQYAFPKEIVDSMHRIFVAYCLMGRADRFLILAGFMPLNMGLSASHGDPSRSDYGENVNRAIDAAGKACAIYPISINLYDFGCVLRSVGYEPESKATFTEFLRRHKSIPVLPHEKLLFAGHNVDEAVRDATRETTEPLDEAEDQDFPF